VQSSTGGYQSITAPSTNFLVYVWGHNTTASGNLPTVTLPDGVSGSVTTLATWHLNNNYEHCGMFQVECPAGTTITIVTTGNSANGYGRIYTFDIT
jgi:hypothetical protein